MVVTILSPRKRGSSAAANRVRGLIDKGFAALDSAEPFSRGSHEEERDSPDFPDTSPG